MNMNKTLALAALLLAGAAQAQADTAATERQQRMDQAYASSHDGSSGQGTVSRDLHEAGHSIHNGVRATGHAIHKGVRATGHALHQGVRATGHAIHKGVDKVTGN